MKKIIIFIFMLSLSLGLASCQSNEEFNVSEEKELVVGLEAAYAPFNWAVTEANDYTISINGQSNMYADGFDVVMARDLAAALNLELVIKAIDWDGLIPALLAGEIDVIIAGMSPTEERAQTVSFSNEYYRSEQVIVVNKNGDYADAESLNDFDGARIVAQLGTLQDGLIDQIEGVNHLQPLKDYPTLAQAIQNNAADGFVAELPVAEGLVQANPNDFTYIAFTEGQGFSASYEDLAVAVALRQEDETLLSLINDALANISTETRNAYMQAALDRQPQS